MSEPQSAAETTGESPSRPQIETSQTSNVEMSDLQSQSAYATPAEEHPPAVATTTAAAPLQPPHSASPSDHPSPPPANPSTQPQTAASSASGVEPIGPSTNATTTASDAPVAAGPLIDITLLLITGARHAYKIDQKYLRKRNVEVEGEDPFNISVYTLKELIWREWRKEWEQRPSSPAYIRLINMGRMLDDKSALKDCRFNHELTNIVHMTVRPQEIIDEEDTAKAGKGGRGDGEEATAGCRCVIL